MRMANAHTCGTIQCITFVVFSVLSLGWYSTVASECPRMFLEGSGYLKPRVSPDGRWVAYFTYEDRGDSLSMRLQARGERTSPARVLLEKVKWASDIAWHPGGGALAALGSADGRGSVGIFSVQGELLRSIPLTAGSPEGGLAWLSDTNRLVVGAGESILVYDSQSSQLVSTINLATFGVDPDLEIISASQRGRLAFAGTRVGDPDGDKTIWLADAWNQSSAPRVLTKGTTDSSPEWVDESTIVFSRGDPVSRWKRCSAEYSARHLWKVSVSTGAEDQLTGGQAKDDYPTSVPDRDVVVFSRVSYDSFDSTQCPESRVLTSKPLSAIMESLSYEAFILASQSRVVYVPLRR